MYEYRATVLQVVDGDTLDVDVDLGFRIHAQVRVRLADVATEGAEAAMEHVEQWVAANGPTFTLCTEKETDGEGWVASLLSELSGLSLNHSLIEMGWKAKLT